MLPLPFHYQLILFIFLPLLHWLETLIQYWKEVVCINYLFLILEGKHLINFILVLAFLIDIFYQMGKSFSNSIIRSGYWVLSSAFSASMEMIICFVIFLYIDCWITLIIFLMLIQHYIKFTWSWYIIYFAYFKIYLKTG